MWMCQNVGLAAGNLLMAIAIITANWQKLADQAVAYAAEEEVRGLLSGVTHYHHCHSPLVALAVLRCLASHFATAMAAQLSL